MYVLILQESKVTSLCTTTTLVVTVLQIKANFKNFKNLLVSNNNKIK